MALLSAQPSQARTVASDAVPLAQQAGSMPPAMRLAQSGRRGGPDHNRARDAVRSGRALPLGRVIDGVRRYCPGRFLGAELQDRGGQLLYFVRILTDRGRRTTIVVDAASGAVVGGRCN